MVGVTKASQSKPPSTDKKTHEVKRRDRRLLHVRYVACGGTVQYSLTSFVGGAILTLHSPFGTRHRVVELQSLP
jgi:hypothetical protein